MPFPGVTDCIVGASGHAVEAHNASRRVDRMGRNVDATGLAYMLASAALDAFVGIDVDVKYGITRHEAESGPRRA